MLVPSLRTTLLAACALAATAPPALGQSREREREIEARERRLRIEREHREDAARARERAEVRRQVELRERLQRDRAARERELRARMARAREEQARMRRRRDDAWREAYRPRITLGGGLDMRRFGGTDDRYAVQGGVDFRTRSGLGVRPEVLFAWGDAPEQPIVGGFGCPVCSTTLPVGNTAQFAPATGRSRMLGVAVSGTYTFARSSPVRPYVMSGLGVFSTRTPQIDVTILANSGPGLPTIQQTGRRFRNDVDVGLTTGAGLEFDVGPIRLFTEFRYLLMDQARPAGFSGMLPLTVGLRL